jgi:hypothetical protein
MLHGKVNVAAIGAQALLPLLPNVKDPQQLTSAAWRMLRVSRLRTTPNGAAR